MVAGVGSSLIQEADRLSVQRHELALEANVANLGDILITVAPIVLDKDCNRGSSVPMGAIQGQFKNVFSWDRSWDLNGLGRGKIGGSREIQVVSVLEKLESLGSCRGGCGVEEDRVQFDLASEADCACVSFACATIR